MNVINLQRLFELRKTNPLKARRICVTVFSFGDFFGFSDESGILFPVVLTGSILPGSLCVFEVSSICVLGLPQSKYSDDTFSFVANLADENFQSSQLQTSQIVTGTRSETVSISKMLYDWCLDLCSAKLDRQKVPAKFFRNTVARQKQNYLKRQQCVYHTMSFFEDKGFFAFDAPVLVPSGKMEPHLNVFHSQYKDFSGNSIPLELCTSPEISIKKLLSVGLTNVYSLAKSFRNEGELSRFHEPEFTMLEWYSAFITVEQQMSFTQKYILHLHEVLKSELLLGVEPWPIFSLPSLFKQLLGFNFFHEETGEQTTPEELFNLIQNSHLITSEMKLRISVNVQDSWEVLFGKCLMCVIEPYLESQVCCFVCHFPSQMAALAAPLRLNLGVVHKALVNRFECYINGVEICNGYEELLGENIYKERLTALLKSSRIKNSTNENFHAVEDFEFSKVMKLGFVPCVGNALGFDRLIMTLCQSEKIQDFFPLPFEKRLQGAGNASFN
jgi:elongation factor P--(R)-beta-lysine ligase